MDLMAAQSMLIGRRRDLKRTGTQIGMREYNAAIWAIERALTGEIKNDTESKTEGKNH
jgi:hypothetical protein